MSRERTNNNITVEALNDTNNYECLDVLEHSDIKSVVQKELAENNEMKGIVNMYQIGGMLAVLIASIKITVEWLQYQNIEGLSYFSIGVLLSFSLLILFHEAVHALAYRCVGAKQISFGADIQRFMFYVQADREVLNQKQFTIVALSPAIVVALLSIVGMIWYYNTPPFYLFLAVVSIHSFFVVGDMGMLAYFLNRPSEEILTFDIKKEKKTYFFKKKNQ